MQLKADISSMEYAIEIVRQLKTVGIDIMWYVCPYYAELALSSHVILTCALSIADR